MTQPHQLAQLHPQRANDLGEATLEISTINAEECVLIDAVILRVILDLWIERYVRSWIEANCTLSNRKTEEITLISMVKVLSTLP